jgi:hypothetical protein
LTSITRRNVLLLHAHREAVPGDPGVVDQDVKGSQRGARVGDGALHGLVVGHVAVVGLRADAQRPDLCEGLLRAWRLPA